LPRPARRAAFGKSIIGVVGAMVATMVIVGSVLDVGMIG
jgi:hypothetical protein